MFISEKSKQHIDSCRFCWMCHHICPIGNATGLERNTARARALGLSLVTREAIGLEEVIDNVYECAGCGGCVSVCVTGWDPVMFTKEVRLQAALEGKLPEYIQKLVANCLETGNAYGVKALDSALEAKIKEHSAKADTLLVLGADARYKMPEQAIKAIKVLEKADVNFTVLVDEPATGAQLDFLVGAANEAKSQMTEMAKVMNGYDTVVIYDPFDAKVIKRVYGEYGIELTAKAVTYTAYLNELLEKGQLKAEKTGKTVVFQDPFQLARDLEETEEARNVIMSYADLTEMLLNRKETVWAGNLLMGEYIPVVMKQVAERRLYNVTSIGQNAVVTACVSEYASLKAIDQNEVEVLSIEDLILG